MPGTRLYGGASYGLSRSSAWGTKRYGEGEGEQGEDDAQRREGADLDPVGGEHLEGGEGQHCGQAVVQKAQAGERANQNEVERAQAHDGHDVGGVGEEGVARDGEDGGDRVEGEDYVAELDGDESEQQEGRGGAAILADEEAVLARADGVQASKPGEPAGCSGRLGLIFGD